MTASQLGHRFLYLQCLVSHLGRESCVRPGDNFCSFRQQQPPSV